MVVLSRRRKTSFLHTTFTMISIPLTENFLDMYLSLFLPVYKPCHGCFGEGCDCQSQRSSLAQVGRNCKDHEDLPKARNFIR